MRPERQRQNRRQPWRCQPSTVSGRTRSRGPLVPVDATNEEPEEPVPGSEVGSALAAEGDLELLEPRLRTGGLNPNRLLPTYSRLARISDVSRASLHGFIKTHIRSESMLLTNPWQGYTGIDGTGYSHNGVSIRDSTENASELLPRVHRVAALRCWPPISRIRRKAGSPRRVTQRIVTPQYEPSRPYRSMRSRVTFGAGNPARWRFKALTAYRTLGKERGWAVSLLATRSRSASARSSAWRRWTIRSR